MIGADVSDDARRILADLGLVVHSAADMISFVNASQREVVNLVPASNTKKRDYTLTALETAQPLPQTVVRLADVVRNTGADGLIRGKPVRVTTEGELSAHLLNWTQDEPAEEVVHFVYDDQVPDEFLVWPRPLTATHLELRTVDLPVDITDLAQPLTLPAIYRNAMAYYVVSLALSKIDDDAMRPIATDFAGRCKESLGIKVQTDIARKPRESK
jgi:hypothetical protein